MTHVTSEMLTEFFQVFVFTINFLSVTFKTKFNKFDKVYTIEL